MAEKKYDRELLAYKIQWEGGVMGALNYGLKPDDIGDPELRAAWGHLQQVHAQLQPLIQDFERCLRTAV